MTVRLSGAENWVKSEKYPEEIYFIHLVPNIDVIDTSYVADDI